MSPQAFDAWLMLAQRPPLVMGVLNVTPDSFSDGGRLGTTEAAVEVARGMVAEGADLLDVGGESTRPGSAAVAEDEQVRRVAPVIAAIRRELDVAVSIDTTRAGVARAALDAGAAVVNDVSAGTDDPGIFPLVAGRGVPMILMHMRGRPATMQVNPTYQDVVDEVRDFLKLRIDAAAEAGVDRGRLLIDPGFGFGKTVGHNLLLLRRLSELGGLGRPIVLGTSRKGFIGAITGQDRPADRTFGTAATVAWGIAHGAGVVRVHDVGPMAQVVRVVRAIRDA